MTRPCTAMLVQGGVVALACAAWLAPLPATAVERWYTGGVYRAFQRVLTPLSNLAPVAVLDLLLAAALVASVVALVRAVRRARELRRVAPLGATLWRFVVAGAVISLVFLACWGLNYRRVPLAERIEMTPGVPDPEAVAALGLTAAARVNVLHASARAGQWEAPAGSAALRDGFAAIDARLGARAPLVIARPRPTALGWYFRWAGIDGMLDPFALEVLLNPDLLPFELPFTLAHEWAHLAGYADEAEASFIGWLACVRAGGAAAYSGWLALFVSIQADVPRETRETLLAALDEGPRADLSAMAERQRRGQVAVVREAGSRAYDQYLRANRVEDGIERYGAVVTLATRARFADGWMPVPRDATSR